MKAMVLQEPKPIGEHPLVLTELPDPEPGPGEVRIRVSVCGLCHTDLHTVEGDLDLPRLPIIPGHQVIGEVEKLGPGPHGLTPGDRVGVAWLHKTCGRCFYCLEGSENLCGAAGFTGLGVNGGFAEMLIARSAFVYPIPDDFEDLQAAPLLCAGIIGYRAFCLSETMPGETVALFGFGASAHVTIQVARAMGAEVYVFSRGEEHRRHAAELGATWTGTVEDAPPEPIDTAILFAPAGPMVLDVLRHLRPGGTAAIAGIHLSPIPEMDYGKYLYGERTLRSVTANTREDGRELLKLAARIPIITDVEEFPLEKANEALGALARSEICGAAVLRIAP